MEEKKLAFRDKNITKEERKKGKVKLFFDKWKERMAIGAVGLTLIAGSAAVQYGCNCKAGKEQMQDEGRKLSPQEQKEVNEQLIEAVTGGDADRVKKLIKKGANANAKDNFGTVLVKACDAQYDEIVGILVENGADVNSRDDLFGATPLISASIHKGNITILEILVDAGAEIDAKDDFERTPLIYAAGFGDAEMIKFLLDNGADPDIKGQGMLVKKKQTALELAVYLERSENVKVLKAHSVKIDPEKQEKVNGQFLKAVKKGKIKKVKELLENGADIGAKDETDTTALMYAAWGGFSETTKLLIEKGADVNAVNKSGFGVLGRAAELGLSAEVVKLLVEAGADVNGKTCLCKKEGSPLMGAAMSGHTEIARILVEAGADVDAKDMNGETALMAASTFGHADIAGLLIGKGADVNAKGYDEESSLFMASNWGHMETVKLLVDAGADVNAKNVKGWTPLTIASLYKHKDVIKFLKEHGAKE